MSSDEQTARRTSAATALTFFFVSVVATRTQWKYMYSTPHVMQCAEITNWQWDIVDRSWYTDLFEQTKHTSGIQVSAHARH